MRELTFIRPVDGDAKITSVFDETRPRGRKHKGIDYGASKGTPVVASEGGIIIARDTNIPGYGNLIIIDHIPMAKEDERHIYTLYAHLNTFGVGLGETVKKGTAIGSVGHSGYAYSKTGKDPSHLHFEVIDCPWKASRTDILSKKGRAREYRKNPTEYLNTRTIIKGTLDDLTGEGISKIEERLSYKYVFDLPNKSWRIDVSLDGVVIGHIDKDHSTIRTKVRV